MFCIFLTFCSYIYIIYLNTFSIVFTDIFGVSSDNWYNLWGTGGRMVSVALYQSSLQYQLWGCEFLPRLWMEVLYHGLSWQRLHVFLSKVVGSLRKTLVSFIYTTSHHDLVKCSIELQTNIQQRLILDNLFKKYLPQFNLIFQCYQS